ncbi:hypothetical protein A3J13_01585 [Candidatus Daviesbacteria bacterium RIFCSPLOWO2_02_FULL_36_8]|uniref:Uncharacterized protein n=1 Tax=Candidatus Daviesbacteria bacterium RIFCSPLOWO2_02_FULL_36_8 TaxID=1797793 RepID=A0A1F5MH02_9BACT|nr:MAG: hypothetical protein A3J13_01585 [Candidatus Daviesbacteria bacterium RIFCSPLOWO2_02_FULL_36_8]
MKIELAYREKSILPLLARYPDKKYKDAPSATDVVELEGMAEVLRSYPDLGMFKLRSLGTHLSVQNMFVYENWGDIRAYYGMKEAPKTALFTVNSNNSLLVVNRGARCEVELKIAPNEPV